MRHLLLWVMVSISALAAPICHAADHNPCRELDNAFPQPGRNGGGENAYRPLPIYSPVRAQSGAPGTISLDIDVNHLSSAPKGKPGITYAGNYQVTNIPVFRFTTGANTNLQVVRDDDGKTFPISDACLDSPDWGFGGTTWALVQGDTLDVMVQSRLDYVGGQDLYLPTNGAVPCRASNLHTHGLLVSPYHPKLAGHGPYGDYVLDTTQPKDSFFGADIDNCGTLLGGTDHKNHGLTQLPLHIVTTIPGQPGVNSMLTGEHPSGLFWYHPHPHGFSGSQIGGGTTGALTVGALTDYACPAGDGTPGNCTITNANTRIMVLKDTELQAAGTGWTTIPNYESGLCTNSGGTRLGECQGIEGNIGPSKWVFTINGVQYPVVRVAAGRMEIWRLVNSSRTMAWDLSLLSTDPSHAALPFQILAKDGVSVAQPHGHGVIRTHLLMFPSSRVEIAIPAPAGGGTYSLHNSVVQTGGNGHGDTWPEFELARFTWDKPPEGAQLGAQAGAQLGAQSNVQAAAASPVQVSGPATPIPHVAEVVDGPGGPCTFRPGDKRVIYFTHRFVHILGDDAHAAGGDDDNAEAGAGRPPGGILPHTNEVFGLIASIRHPDGTEDFYSQAQKGVVLHSINEVWAAGKAADTSFPGFMHNDWGTVCTVKGNVEPWLLVNYTGEDHNFHIHQSRFAIDPNGEFQFPRHSIPAAAPLQHTDEDLKAFADPAVAVLNDNIPVPRGQTFCAVDPTGRGCRGTATHECSGSPDLADCPHPGKMSIIMDFSRAEQVGTFVYHCHIMEHEDGGMMAMIRVLCPKGDASCASQQAEQVICRPPEGE